jgi:hypothetical protein
MTSNLSPLATNLAPYDEPVVQWGVHFSFNDSYANYGAGDAAKRSAEKVVEEWSNTPHPAVLVSRVILPWSPDVSTVIPLVQAIRQASTDPSAVIRLREWLLEVGYETEHDRKTGLRHQVPLVKQIRKSMGITQALEYFHVWLGTNGYKNE